MQPRLMCRGGEAAGIHTPDIEELRALPPSIRRYVTELAASEGAAHQELALVAEVRPPVQWLEEDGPVLWWTADETRAPYLGTPFDESWPEPSDEEGPFGAFTGWTRRPRPFTRAAG
jgi:hypothetical protein